MRNRHRIAIQLVAAAFLAGCATQPAPEKTAMSREQKLQNLANLVDSDPDTTNASKSLAHGAVQQVRTNQELGNMMDGK